MADIKDDEPLDPEVEAIRRKMMRLLMVSGGIMMVGLMTVLIAIVYKINQGNDETTVAGSSNSRTVTEANITLPAGATIIDTALDANRIMLTLKKPDGTMMIQVHRVNGDVVGRYAVK